MNVTAERHGSLVTDHPRWWSRRWLKVVLTLCVLFGVGIVFTAEYILHNAEPILRKRIVETLSARFHSPVELDGLSISLFKGIEVEGTGLRIPARPNGSEGASQGEFPLLAVRRFAFRTTFRGLLRQPTYVRRVEVDGMEVHIPPADERARLVAGWTDAASTGASSLGIPGFRPKIALIVDELSCTDVRVVLDPGEAAIDEARALHRAKAPLAIDIRSLTLRRIGAQQTMLYEADLINPKPVGEVHVSGDFGPWDSAAPGGTPLDGSYRFTHADLATIKGIGGTLSSSGRFSGVLNRIGIDGETDTPNFSLDISNHSLPLQTRFHAIVDGTSGDTYLQAVHARLGGSDFTTSGKVVKLAGRGHDIELVVDIPHGRMQDFLRLAAKTNPPLMNGSLTMHTTLRIPPGPARVAEKMAMAGRFSLAEVRFNNRRLQSQIDGLSARASGHPDQVKVIAQERRDPASPYPADRSLSRVSSPAQMGANFSIERGNMDVTDVRFAIPGATVQMNGVYSMDGRLFEFRGHVRTQATASEMVGGWKGMLLKPLDHLLAKNGAGVELPIEVSGTEGDVHLGLAMHGVDATPSQMLADVHAKQNSRAEMTSARRKSALADQEDLAAAHAPTLEAAERAHAAAVRHRAEAQRLALGPQAGVNSTH